MPIHVALIVGDKKTIVAINDLFLNNNDQSALNKFLTQANWDECKLNRRRVELEMARRVVRSGRQCLDDLLAELR